MRGRHGPASWVVLIILTTVIAGIGVTWGVSVALDQSEPTYWGTFTQQSCSHDGGTRRCRPVGTWVSGTDESLRLTGVVLDGIVEEDQTAEALWRPTDTFNLHPPYVVRTARSEAVQLWFPWLIAAVAAAGAVYGARRLTE